MRSRTQVLVLPKYTCSEQIEERRGTASYHLTGGARITLRSRKKELTGGGAWRAGERRPTAARRGGVATVNARPPPAGRGSDDERQPAAGRVGDGRGGG